MRSCGRPVRGSYSTLFFVLILTLSQLSNSRSAPSCESRSLLSQMLNASKTPARRRWGVAGCCVGDVSTVSLWSHDPKRLVQSSLTHSHNSTSASLFTTTSSRYGLSNFPREGQLALVVGLPNRQQTGRIKVSVHHHLFPLLLSHQHSHGSINSPPSPFLSTNTQAVYSFHRDDQSGTLLPFTT
jgi:hypothetical protein